MRTLPATDRCGRAGFFPRHRSRSQSLLWLLCPLLPLCPLLLCGCHVTGRPLAQVISAYDQGDVDTATQQLSVLAEQSDAEEDIVALNGAVIDLMGGRPDSAVRTLEQTRRHLIHLQQFDVRDQTVAALKDDSRIAWSGREFERRMADNLLILASLLQNHDDAYSLALRGMESVRVDRLELQPAAPEPNDESDSEQPSEPAPVPPRYTANQLTAWLAAAVRSENIQDADLTDSLIQQAAAWDPGGRGQTATLQTLGTHTSPDCGSLQVIVLAGRITEWRSERMMPTTAALLVADRILSATADHSLPPSTSPVVIASPVHHQYTPEFQTRVFVDGCQEQSGQLVVDLNEAAWDSCLATRDDQLARAVVRRVVKKSAVYGAKDALDVPKGSGTDLLLNVAGVLWESRERADLRHWNLLPAGIELAQMELPAGRHSVRLQVVPSGAGDSAVVADQLEIPVTVENGRNTYVVCFRPGATLVNAQTNRPGQ